MPGQLCRIGSQGFSNSGGNTLVQLSRMILGAWSPSPTGKILCRFCAWCISAGNAPCAKTAKGMRQRQSLCLHGTIAPTVCNTGDVARKDTQISFTDKTANCLLRHLLWPYNYSD